MRTVICLCTLMVISTLNPDLWKADYQPPKEFLWVLGITWVIAIVLDLFDGMARWASLAAEKKGKKVDKI